MTLRSLQNILSYSGSILAGVLLLRLWFEGLLSRYRFFGFYLFILVGEAAVLLGVRQGSNRYARVYVTVESALWVVQILMILEMFTLVLRGFPGIASYGRKFIVVALVLAFLISFGFSALNPPASPATEMELLSRYLLISRVISFTILAFFALLLVFLFWFPIPLSRNVVIYTIGFSVYFASRPIMRLAANLTGASLPVIFLYSIASEIIVAACLLFWIVFLTRKGEATDVTVGHRWKPGETEALIGQLESINAVLLRTARK